MNALNRSLASRMTTLILVGAGLILFLVLGFNYILQRQWTLASAMNQGTTLTQSVLSRIEAHLTGPEAVVEQTALVLAANLREWNRYQIINLIHETLNTHPGLMGMAVALNEDIAAESDFSILYGWRENSSLLVRDREWPELDYQHDWFYLPYYLKTPQWIDPYFDTDARVLMVTYSVPVLIGDTVAAVVTCDLSLEEIRNMLDNLPLGEQGIAVLLSRWGTFISHPQRNLEVRDTIFSLAEAQQDMKGQETLANLGRKMLSGKPGHLEYKRPFNDEVAFMHYGSIPSTGWALGIIHPKAQLLSPLIRLNRISAMIGFFGIVLLLVPALAIALSVSRPLHQLAESSRLLAQGDFNASLPRIRGRDEVAQLTASFDHMRRELLRYIDDLTTTTAAKERIASELSIAREIQLGIVPKLFPPFPDRNDIDLYAVLIPAREVGGDLYDFGLLDENHLYIAIGDVSGKGVPASLLMAVGKTLMKSTIYNLRDPGRALAEVNKEIGEDNDACMFITMFCGILNLKTGDFIYANGGHNPPFLSRGNGMVEMLETLSGPALGIVPDVIYHNKSIRLELGNLLVLYTDGITEAMNPSNELFEDHRLNKYISEHFSAEAREFINGLSRTVHDFADGAEQSDDITALVVRFIGHDVDGNSVSGLCDTTQKPPLATLSLANHLDELERLTSWLDVRGSAMSLPQSLVANINLALEEWIVNVISYAWKDEAEHRIEIRLWYLQEELRIEIEDDGEPFDPTGQAEVDTSLALEQRSIGGLGIHFIRAAMDGFFYRREKNLNIVTLVKQIPRQ